MSHKKAFICTMLLAIIAIGIVVISLISKDPEREMNLFEFISPFIVGHWIGERLLDFYNWLRKV